MLDFLGAGNLEDLANRSACRLRALEAGLEGLLQSVGRRYVTG